MTQLAVYNFLQYLKYFTISLKEHTNFKIDFFIRLSTGFISSYARVVIWVVIMSGNTVLVGTNVAQQTIRYMIMTGFISVIIYAGPRSTVFQRVQDGTIARDLLYPVSFPATLYWRALGDAFFGILVRGIPTLVLLSVIFSVQWPVNIVAILLFLLFSLLGFSINFFINEIVDMAAFWIFETRGLEYILDAVREFFAGRFIPLWFYPVWILPVINWLPFKNIVYVPIAFLIGEIPLSEAPVYLAISGAWCLVFLLIMVVVWRSGVKKTVINGG